MPDSNQENTVTNPLQNATSDHAARAVSGSHVEVGPSLVGTGILWSGRDASLAISMLHIGPLGSIPPGFTLYTMGLEILLV